MLKKGIELKIFVLLLILMFQITSPALSEKGNAISCAFKPSGKTLYVGGNGSNNYTTIQDAIDNASYGDTIFVYNGTYYENVVIHKSIKLMGENKSTMIIDR